MVLISHARLDELLSIQLKIYLYLGRVKPMSHDGFMANYRIEPDAPLWMKITREFELHYFLFFFLSFVRFCVIIMVSHKEIVCVSRLRLFRWRELDLENWTLLISRFLIKEFLSILFHRKRKFMSYVSIIFRLMVFQKNFKIIIYICFIVE